MKCSFDRGLDGNAAPGLSSASNADTSARGSFRRGDIRGEVLTGADTDINTVAEPKKVIPQPASVQPPIAGAGPVFNHELPPRSVTVLRVRTR